MEQTLAELSTLKRSSLRGDRLTLEPLDERHARRVVEWRNDARILPFFFSAARLELDGQLAWTRAQAARDGDFTYVMEAKGEPVGMIALYGLDLAARSAEIGRVLVAPERQGRGLAREAARLLLALAFDRLGLASVYANVLADNAASLALFSGLGFAETDRAADPVRRASVRLELAAPPAHAPAPAGS